MRCVMSRLLGAGVAALLAGCAVGPDFHPPAPPATSTYYVPEKETAPQSNPPTQALEVGAELPGEWWHLFQSSHLAQTLKTALANSPTLAQASATLAQAQEEVRVAQAALLPHIGANAGVQRNG